MTQPTQITSNALKFSLWVDGRTTAGQAVTGTTYSELIAEITLAEQLGYYGLWATEHHGFDDGYLPAPFTFLAYVAGRTQRLRLGTNILLLPLWPIRLVTEETAVLDILSGGRVTLGLGLGYVPNEFAAFGIPLSQRKKRMETGITYMRSAFETGYAPDGYQGSNQPVAPQPIQGVQLPIYIGANTEVAIDRAARLADGFLSAANNNPLETLAKQWAILRSRLEAHGRDTKTFPFVASLHLWASDDPERDWETLIAPAIAYQASKYMEMSVEPGQTVPPLPEAKSLKREDYLVDTPKNIVTRIRAIRAQVPVTEICFWSHLPGIPHKEAQGNIERIADKVMPEFA